MTLRPSIDFIRDAFFGRGHAKKKSITRKCQRVIRADQETRMTFILHITSLTSCQASILRPRTDEATFCRQAVNQMLRRDKDRRVWTEADKPLPNKGGSVIVGNAAANL